MTTKHTTLRPAGGDRRVRARPIAYAACLLIACGCGSGGEAGDHLVVYVCTETRAVIRAEPQPAPAVNPHTGRRTLARGMYCAECAAWFPVPADAPHPESIRCRRHGRRMSLSGPEIADSGEAVGQ